MSVGSAISNALGTVFRPSGWKFVTSAGAALSVGTPIVHLGINAEGGAIYLTRGSERVRLVYGGIGGCASLSLVPSPVNFSFSMKQMPSNGVVYRLPYAGASLDRKELCGGCVMFEISGDTGPGASGNMMFLGGSEFFALAAAALTVGTGYLPALIASSNGVVFFGGMTATLLPFNVSAAVYIGGVSG